MRQVVRQVEGGQRTPGREVARARGQLSGHRVKTHGQRGALRHGDGGAAALGVRLRGSQHGAEGSRQNVAAAGGGQPPGASVHGQQARRCRGRGGGRSSGRRQLSGR